MKFKIPGEVEIEAETAADASLMVDKAVHYRESIAKLPKPPRKAA